MIQLHKVTQPYEQFFIFIFFCSCCQSSNTIARSAVRKIFLPERLNNKSAYLHQSKSQQQVSCYYSFCLNFLANKISSRFLLSSKRLSTRARRAWWSTWPSTTGTTRPLVLEEPSTPSSKEIPPAALRSTPTWTITRECSLLSRWSTPSGLVTSPPCGGVTLTRCPIIFPSNSAPGLRGCRLPPAPHQSGERGPPGLQRGIRPQLHSHCPRQGPGYERGPRLLSWPPNGNQDGKYPSGNLCGFTQRDGSRYTSDTEHKVKALIRDQRFNKKCLRRGATIIYVWREHRPFGCYLWHLKLQPLRCGR